jgi:hypothetical protein
MAVTLTQDGELLFASFPIEKMETDANGDLYVYGKATDGAVDSDDQIVDPVWAAKAIKDWLDTGANLRVQHNPSRDPAGIGVEITDDGRGGQWVKSLVVEPVAKNLVKKGVLQAYSVGIMRPIIVPDQLARNGRIVGGELGELSLVDRPANKGCRFELVKSFGGNPQFVGKMFGTETLNKAHTSDTVTVEVPRSAKIKITPADLAKMLQKRDFDPGVGGGVDRDKLPAADFGDPDNEKYPIVIPKDVHDAGLLIGHASDPEAVKRRITSIAHRKGPDFVAQIPDSWKGGSTDTDDANKTAEDDLNKGKKPFPGAKPPYKKDSDGDGKPEQDDDWDDKDDDDEKDEQAKPDVSKSGGKDCKKCGKSYHSDSKIKKCENCGAKLPVAKTVDEDLFKGAQSTGMGDDDEDDGSEQNDDEDDSSEGSGDDGAASQGDNDSDAGDDEDDAKAAKKAMRKMLKKMAKQMAVEMIAKGEITAGRTKPTPADGVTGEHAEPVAPHREPDGPDVEAFEQDAKLPTDPDAQYKALMYTKGLNIPDDMAALHDLLCPAYSSEAAHAAHPHTTIKSVDVQRWRELAFKAASSATIDEAMAATTRLEHVGTLTQAPEFVLDEVHQESHRAFKAINPDNTSALRPGAITPGSYNRPYLSNDARPSFQQQGPNSGPGGFGSVMPNDFERGFLTDGRAANSPSSGSGSLTIPKPSTTGVPKSVDLTNALRANVQQAASAMHDHIAQTYPDLCAMRSTPTGGGAAVNAAGIGKAAEPTTPKVKASKAKVTKAATATAPGQGAGSGSDLLMKAFGPDVIKGAMVEALAPLLARLESTETALLEQRAANKALEVQLNKLAELPDPNVAPFRGIAQDLINKSSGAPVGAPDPSGIAARVQMMVQNELVQQSYSTDPTAREAALNALYSMRGLSSQQH